MSLFRNTKGQKLRRPCQLPSLQALEHAETSTRAVQTICPSVDLFGYEQNNELNTSPQGCKKTESCAVPRTCASYEIHRDGEGMNEQKISNWAVQTRAVPSFRPNADSFCLMKGRVERPLSHRPQ